jgi:hypothetical protein
VFSTATVRIDVSLLFLDSASRVDDLTFFPLSVIGYLKRIISHHQRIEKAVFSDKLQPKLRLQVPLSDLCLQKRILQTEIKITSPTIRLMSSEKNFAETSQIPLQKRTSPIPVSKRYTG